MKSNLFFLIAISVLVSVGCSQKKDQNQVAAANAAQTGAQVGDNRICRDVEQCRNQCNSIYPTCTPGPNCTDMSVSREQCLNARVNQILIKPGGGDVVLASKIAPMSFIPQGSRNVDFSFGISLVCDDNGNNCELMVRAN